MPGRLYPSDKDRFEAAFVRGAADECWNWNKGRTAKGYGAMRFKGVPTVSSRIAYSICIGEIPEGMFVCHRCDNPLCVNPAHLFLGDNAANMADKVFKERQSRGEKHSAATRGERNGAAKLTEHDVSLIRRIANESQKAIAKRFGVDPSIISRIRNGHYWPHVTA